MFPSKIKKAICLVIFLLVAQPQILRCTEDTPSNQDQVEAKASITEAEHNNKLLIGGLVSATIIIALAATVKHIISTVDITKECIHLKNGCTLYYNEIIPPICSITHENSLGNMCSCKRVVTPAIPREEWFATFTCKGKQLCHDLGLEQ